ncbi:MAG: GNAT family N-acetyltransferase [Epsilonproteobacteria bacterium]|nr:GNAT family N-acetyltransferase [Campylobacterota bacterium]
MRSYQIEEVTQSSEAQKYISDSIISYGLAQLDGDVPQSVCYVVKNSDEKLIGGIMGQATRNMLFISHLFVDESYRGEGLGAKLMLNIEASAQKLGCDLMRLNTFNQKTNVFYKRLGYKETTIIRSYMNGFDLVYYEKALN